MRRRLSILPLLLWVMACLPSAGTGQVLLQHYGVDDIGTAQYAFLKDSLHGNFALVELKADSAVWKHALSEAEKNGLSLIIWPLGHGDRYTPWKYYALAWDITEGEAAMAWAERYVAAGGKALTAVLMSHEPFYSSTTKVFFTYQLKQLYSALKGIAPHVKLFMYLNDIAYYDSTNVYRQMEEGMVDIAGTYKHHFGTKHTLEEALKEIEDDYALIRRKGLNIQLYFALQCFSTDDITYRMPSAAEMQEYATKILATGKLNGVFWYPWDRSSTTYSRWLSKDRYDSSGADRWAVVRGLAPDLPAAVTAGVAEAPQTYMLSQNYPNPFNPTTSISMSIPHEGVHALAVFDLLGRKVAEIFRGPVAAGARSVTFDAGDLPSGVYFYALTGPNVRLVKSMVLLR